MANDQQWFRTGAVSRQTGISQYRLRALARAGIIPSRTAGNGMLYISAGTVEELKTNGPPPMPVPGPETEAGVNLDNKNAEDIEDRAPGIAETRPAQRSRLLGELYAKPSLELARAKEKLIQQQLVLETKRVQQEARELELETREAARRRREERKRERQAEQAQAWRDGLLREAFTKLPAHRWTEVSVEVEAALRGGPFIEAQSRIHSIIDRELQAERIRKFDQQLRLLDTCSRLVERRLRR